MIAQLRMPRQRFQFLRFPSVNYWSVGADAKGCSALLGCPATARRNEGGGWEGATATYRLHTAQNNSTKAISNRRGIRLPIPKMGALQSKNALQQSRQRGDPFCVVGKRAGKFASLSLINPNQSRTGGGPAMGSRCRGQQDRDGDGPMMARRGAADDAEAGCERRRRGRER